MSAMTALVVLFTALAAIIACGFTLMCLGRRPPTAPTAFACHHEDRLYFADSPDHRLEPPKRTQQPG